MSEKELLLQGIQIAGVSIFLFVLFYYYMRKQFELFDRSMDDQRKKNELVLTATTKAFERILEEQRERDRQAYDLNKELIETLQHQAGVISRMEHKIDTLPRNRS